MSLLLGDDVLELIVVAAHLSLVKVCEEGTAVLELLTGLSLLVLKGFSKLVLVGELLVE